MPSPLLNTEQLNTFYQDGFIIVRNFCSRQETDKLYGSAVLENSLPGGSLDLNGLFNRKAKLPLWFTPGNDVFGYLSRSEKIVKSIAQLLENDSPVCHIQSKLMRKEPRLSGVWEWHQDYAYWYKNQFMYPNQLASVMVALTAVSKENGCSQLIKGSHKLGRLNHRFEGDLAGADRCRVGHALQQMEIVYPELEAGDALFFHSNLLHRSDANLSDHSSWSVISCYSSQANLPTREMFTSWHTPVDVVPDEAILKWATGYMSANNFVYS